VNHSLFGRPMAAGVAVIAVAGLLAGAGTATAATTHQATAPKDSTAVDKTLAFTCPFPLIGNQTLSIRIQATMSTPATVGGQLVTTDFTATATVPDSATLGLNLIGAATIEGSAQANVTLNEAGTPLDVAIPNLVIPSTPVPASGPFNTVASGPVPTATINAAGTTTVTVAGFSTTLTPKQKNGSPTALGTFTSSCTLNAGQNAQLISFDVAASN
jgi:Family of unknown function (DUF6801)